MPAVATEQPAGYLVARAHTTCARRMAGGEVVPAQSVTPLLIELGWIRGVDEAELEAAIATHGRPPEELRVGWEMIRDGEPPAGDPPTDQPPIQAPPASRKRTKKKKTKKRARK